ncbi:MAG: hypothetical protein RDV41_12780, partial [Planctomycetota bacterium]|nr:hypothetical protein [Planctomycetota bacterium]
MSILSIGAYPETDPSRDRQGVTNGLLQPLGVWSLANARGSVFATSRFQDDWKPQTLFEPLKTLKIPKTEEAFPIPYLGGFGVFGGWFRPEPGNASEFVVSPIADIGNQGSHKRQILFDVS